MTIISTIIKLGVAFINVLGNFLSLGRVRLFMSEPFFATDEVPRIFHNKLSFPISFFSKQSLSLKTIKF